MERVEFLFRPWKIRLIERLYKWILLELVSHQFKVGLNKIESIIKKAVFNQFSFNILHLFENRLPYQNQSIRWRLKRYRHLHYSDQNRDEEKNYLSFIWNYFHLFTEFSCKIFLILLKIIIVTKIIDRSLDWFLPGKKKPFQGVKDNHLIVSRIKIKRRGGVNLAILVVWSIIHKKIPVLQEFIITADSFALHGDDGGIIVNIMQWCKADGDGNTVCEWSKKKNGVASNGGVNFIFVGFLDFIKFCR